ncbi:hypothetical protein [Streptomyces spectabilis]|uniref:Tetratricopeptide (TPR) repeat protein n=1 Tax=Streptomyces spectabilis TaxID=68270 RepID=A0A7W8EY04_STRST|nr:hypothetical protein [Streptomyces spectabilis]MBB5107185.1 tetratricopeptide (TPR) repeat protein [Streptomyces spectabilis]MCI3906231.1 hypothetical protein [Streptomyces spectabilis]GGV04004.1 hypothetical protein GCM10010245_08930 [Streptomyces spectabilis]
MEDELGSQGAGGGSNDLSGTVHGHSVQAGHVAGDVTLNVLPPAAHPHVTPYEVPPLSARFFNQVDVLARLDALAAPGQGAPVGVAVLQGLPGVGTTAVIRRWAELKRAWFRGGQLYHDFAALRDRREGADVSEAAGQFLRSLGVDEPLIPDSLQERAARFRSRTAEQPLLVVLENVSRAAQVRALLPRGPGSVVLVTFGGDSGELGELSVEAQLVYVDPLDRASALRLLADRCAQAVAADPEAAARVVELCGRLPLALDIVAGRLRTARSLTLARLADELADATHRLSGLSVGGSRSMTAALDLAYGALPPGTARLYRLLGSLPLTALDESVAAAAAGTDLVDARAHLRELEALSLLEATDDGRHRVHDLVRLHAGERAEREDPPASGRAALARVLDHYLRLTALADRAVRRDRLRVADLTDVLRDAPDPFAAPGGPAPLTWLEAEYPNVLGVLRAAARDPELHVPVWQTAEALTVLFLHHRHLGPWLESLALGAAAAAAAVDPAAEARLRSLRSRPLLDLGEHAEARAELDAAVACAEVSGHTVLRASVQEFLGRCLEHHDLEAAMAAYRASLALNSAAGEERGAAIAAYFLGRAEDAAGRPRAALATLRDAHARLTARADHRMAARATLALGLAHDHLGETDDAVRALTAAAGALHTTEAYSYEADARAALADVLSRTGSGPDAVRPLLTRALEVYEAYGSPRADVVRARLAELGSG